MQTITENRTKIGETALTMPNPISQERIDFLISKGIYRKVAAIDLEMVKMKMNDPKESIGWSNEQCEDAEIEYKRYLTLCFNYPHPHYSIFHNKIMDTMWHYHILDTRAYCKDSENIFGGYFHHYPYFGLRGADDEKALIDSFEKTKEYYQYLFNEPMVRGGQSGCWHDCEDRCWHACSN